MQEFLLSIYLASLGGMMGVLLVGVGRIRFEVAIVFFVMISVLGGMFLKVWIGDFDVWWKVWFVMGVGCCCFLGAFAGWKSEMMSDGLQLRWSRISFAILMLTFCLYFSFNNDKLILNVHFAGDGRWEVFPLLLLGESAMGLLGMFLLFRKDKKINGG